MGWLLEFCTIIHLYSDKLMEKNGSQFKDWMDKMKKNWRRSISWKMILWLMVATFIFLPLRSAWAQGGYPEGQIPAGTTIQGSLFLNASNVKIDGIVDGNVFAIGKTVEVNGEIKGDLIVFSRLVQIEGSLDGHLYAVNSRLILGSGARIGQDALVLALIFRMLEGSTIARDLYLVSLAGQLSGSIGRDQKAYIGLLELLSMIFGENNPLRPLLPSIESSIQPAVKPASFSVEPEHRLPLMSGLGIPVFGLAAALEAMAPAAAIDGAAVGNWLLAQLKILVPLLLIGLLLLWQFPRFLQGATDNLRKRPWASLGNGLVAFFVFCGAGILAVALVVALGFFFSFLDLDVMAWLTWVTGLGTAGIVLAVFYAACVLVSKILLAYLVGSFLLGRVPEKTWGRRFWMLLLGLVIVVLVLAIPTLGWVIAVLAMLFGLGAMYLYLRNQWQRRSSAEALQSTPVVDVLEKAGSSADPEII
jgi:cytoskeletal protein CcmA (bactofilin family)